jgi:CRISPR-associated protein Cst2
MSRGKALTITYLVKTTLASLNGSDKEADNISSIKKITKGAEQYPYGSAQWVRRALRDQLGVLGWNLSEGVAATIAKGASTTRQEPDNYIDDDLFGFMGTEKGSNNEKGSAFKRTSPVRVTPLVSLNRYEGDLDFGTNYMGVEAGGDPNIFETEIHGGIYRGTILIELDRVGCGEGFKDENGLLPEERAKRVKALLSALKNLWSTGRQTRFLADIAPKFVAAAYMSVKNPIFLESVKVINEKVCLELIKEALDDYQDVVLDYVVGSRRDFIENNVNVIDVISIGEAFNKMMQWVDDYYEGIKGDD